MSDKLIFRMVMGVSIAVFLVVVILNRKIIPVTIATPTFVYFLPALNALLNGSCTLLLLLSLYFIKKKDINTHKKINMVAFALSSLFLVSYVTFHYFVKETVYGGVGVMKMIYYIVLVSHIILAAIVLPLVLLSFHKGLQMEVEKHRRLVRWTYPIWLYVTFSGVLVYLMISPYYTF